jgi:hypothetical protein
MHRYGHVVVAIALALMACGDPSAPPACAPVQRLPTPVHGDDLAHLERLMESAKVELDVEEWQLTLLDADEARGTLVFGSERPTQAMCETLRARYGPLVEVIYYRGGSLLGVGPAHHLGSRSG